MDYCNIIVFHSVRVTNRLWNLMARFLPGEAQARTLYLFRTWRRTVCYSLACSSAQDSVSIVASRFHCTIHRRRSCSFIPSKNIQQVVLIDYVFWLAYILRHLQNEKISWAQHEWALGLGPYHLSLLLQRNRCAEKQFSNLLSLYLVSYLRWKFAEPFLQSPKWGMYIRLTCNR